METSYLSYKPVELAFGTSGLRGLIKDMTDLECYVNVTGFLQYLEKNGHLKTGYVYIAGDLRSSTPRIMSTVCAAIVNFGQVTVNCGFIPTPALAYYAQLKTSPCIMVTGSHIPDDRNGIKFYTSDGEILKTDEDEIKQCVSSVRENLYNTLSARFNDMGELQVPMKLPEVDDDARIKYVERYTSAFGGALSGKTVVVYQHSAVGRDILVDILEKIGAGVISVGRSDKFIPIDTENVTVDDQVYFKTIAQDNPNNFAILSTDGDSDRPFVIDEKGIFHRGDDLGALVAGELDVDFAAYPISSSDAVDEYLDKKAIAYEHTKIGSPYVIAAMQEANKTGKTQVVGWEVNGGFLIGSDVAVDGRRLTRLPTRDAFFPMLYALKVAADSQKMVSDVFDSLPKRYTQAGMIDDFPNQVYVKMKDRFSADTEANRDVLSNFFGVTDSFGALTKVNSLDGIRMYFDNHDIAHFRASGNAPQLRIYSVADTQARANEIVSDAIKEVDGIFRKLEAFIMQDS